MTMPNTRRNSSTTADDADSSSHEMSESEEVKNNRIGSDADLITARRRRFLQAIGGAATVGLAGCSGGNGGNSTSTNGNSGGRDTPASSNGESTATSHTEETTITSSNGVTVGDVSGSGTLEFNLFSGQLSSDNKKAFKNFVSEWEDKSGWKINLTMTPQAAGVTQKERSRFEAGDPFDVMTVMGVAAFNFASQGYLADISDFLDNSHLKKDDFASTTLIEGVLNARGPFNGTLQVIPMMIGHWGAFYYNAELFRDAGYDPKKPQKFLQTPSDLLDAAKKVKKNSDVRPLGYSGADNIHTALQFYSNMWSRGDTHSMVVDGKPQFSSKQGLAAAKMYETMKKEDLLPKGVLNKNEIDMRNLFEKNKTATDVVGSWNAALLREQSDVEFGITYAPHLKGVTPSGFGGSPMWGIAKDISSERQKASWSFLEYIMTPEHQAKWSGLSPSLKDAWPIFFKNFTDSLGRNVSDVFKKQINNSGWPYLSPQVGSLNAITQTAIQNIIAGKKSPKKAMNDADKQVKNKILE